MLRLAILFSLLYSVSPVVVEAEYAESPSILL